jgi:hypothetical protein
VDLLVFPFGQEVAIPGVRIVLRCARPWGVKRVGIGFSPQKLLCDVNLIRAARRLLRRIAYHVIHACEESVFPALWLARRHRLPPGLRHGFLHGRPVDGKVGLAAGLPLARSRF